MRNLLVVSLALLIASPLSAGPRNLASAAGDAWPAAADEPVAGKLLASDLFRTQLPATRALAANRSGDGSSPGRGSMASLASIARLPAAADPASAAAVPAAFRQDPAAGADGGAGGGDADASPSKGVSLRGGIGFMLDPDAFLLSAEGAFSLIPNLSLGPLLQFGVSDNRRIFAPSANLQYVFDIPSTQSEALSRLKPFLQGGVGFAYVHRDRGRENDDDVAFLINVGFGAEYELTDEFSIGNNLLFNILPDDAGGENFFFSWQFVTFRYRF